ncbi:YceI family protein [Tamlana sp. s12]|uniref:YceI family protein n=1 Tax=Tamlana sp. s12 TaxID=1630406 RepID=UPI0007FF0465|nr:YceI family protein [Tamlana sp. s12]OBQ52779.1 lipid-binding protein [Tamlana sp. s12]QQY81201.1 YceI family protein [Tamlana sp. s12]
MKKTIKSLAILVFAVVVTSAFTNYKGEKKQVKIESSKVVWKGYKVLGSHEGTVQLKSGVLEFDNDKLTGGEFVIDMTSLVSTDLEGKDSKPKLEAHLKSDDFFGVEKYPTSSLVFTKVKASGKNAYDVTGDLTIKGKTHAVTFTMSIYGSKATASLKIDRTKFDIQYASSNFFDNLKEKAIYDEFDIVADLEF